MTWEGLVIEDNVASGIVGGGGGSMVVRHSIVRNNEAPKNGGGTTIFANSLDYEVSNNLF